jgi:hypothetical protein
MHGTLCDFLSDIVQNSFEAGARSVTVTIEESEREIRFTVVDDGKGMTEEVLKRVQDPFYTDGEKHRKRKVGLGIPFLVQTVESVGGDFSIVSEPQVGTTIAFSFRLDHIDCPPLGDLPSTLMGIMGFSGDCNLVVQRFLTGPAGSDSYRVERRELMEILGDLTTSGTLNLLLGYLRSQETGLDDVRNHA